MATLIEYAPNKFVLKKHVNQVRLFGANWRLELSDGSYAEIDPDYMPIVREHFPITETHQRNRAVIEMLKMVDDVVNELRDNGGINHPALATMLDNLPLPPRFGYKFTEPVFICGDETASERVCLSFFGWLSGRFESGLGYSRQIWRVTREELVDGEWEIAEYHPPLA